MKFVIVKIVTDPNTFLIDDNGEEVPFTYWERQSQEFKTRKEAVDWIEKTTGQIYDPNALDKTIEVRRIQDSVLNPETGEETIIGISTD